jgi:hypothetical protein
MLWIKKGLRTDNKRIRQYSVLSPPNPLPRFAYFIFVFLALLLHCLDDRSPHEAFLEHLTLRARGREYMLNSPHQLRLSPAKDHALASPGSSRPHREWATPFDLAPFLFLCSLSLRLFKTDHNQPPERAGTLQHAPGKRCRLR